GAAPPVSPRAAAPGPSPAVAAWGVTAAAYRSGRKRGLRSRSFATITAVTAAEKVERKEGRTMPAGSFEPSAARTATAPRGRMATPAALMERNSAMELVATPGYRLSVFSSLIALSPNGVAALPSPSMLAARLRIIDPIAG